MKTITLMLAAAAMTFAQAPAAPSTQTPAKDATGSTVPVKKHAKKHAGKKAVTPAPAAAAAPASK